MSEILMKKLRPSEDEVLSIARCLAIVILTYVSLISARWLLKMVRLLAAMFEPMNYELVSK